MAIRSTNANRNGSTAKPAAGTGNRGTPNTDGPGNTPIDYGQRPPGSMSKKERWDRRVEEYGMSPWYSNGVQMPWAGGPSSRGKQTPFYTPDPGDPRNAGYFVPEPSAEEQARYDADAKQRGADRKANLMASPQYAAAWAEYEKVRNGPDQRSKSNAIKAVLAAEDAVRRQRAEERFISQGGTAETWRNRFNTSWPVPRSRNGQHWYRPPGAKGPDDPGLPGPTPPGVQGGLPPSQNPMFEGYNPGQSKSGGGQNPNTGPAMSTGNPGNPGSPWADNVYVAPVGGPLYPNTGPARNPGNPGSPWANREMQDQSLKLAPGQMPPWARMGQVSTPLVGNLFQRGGDWFGGGGYNPAATDDLPPGMTFDMPSNNLLSAIRDLKPTSNWKSGSTGTQKPSSKPKAEPPKPRSTDEQRMDVNQREASSHRQRQLEQGGDVMARLMKKWGY